MESERCRIGTGWRCRLQILHGCPGNHGSIVGAELGGGADDANGYVALQLPAKIHVARHAARHNQHGRAHVQHPLHLSKGPDRCYLLASSLLKRYLPICSPHEMCDCSPLECSSHVLNPRVRLRQGPQSRCLQAREGEIAPGQISIEWLHMIAVT